MYYIPPGVAGDMFTVDNATGEVTTTAPLSWLLQNSWIVTGLFMHHTFNFYNQFAIIYAEVFHLPYFNQYLIVFCCT